MPGMLGLFFGSDKRNDPIRIEDPRPIATFGSDSFQEQDAGLCGYSVLSRADPNYQGSPPPVNGVLGRAMWGPNRSFEE
jgi:hypothetical protein